MPEILKDISKEIVVMLLGGVFAIFGFLVRAYFARMQTDIKNLSKDIAKLDGKFEVIRQDVRENSEVSLVTQRDVSALWRFLDNSHQRTSDLGK